MSNMFLCDFSVRPNIPEKQFSKFPTLFPSMPCLKRCGDFSPGRTLFERFFFFKLNNTKPNKKITINGLEFSLISALLCTTRVGEETSPTVPYITLLVYVCTSAFLNRLQWCIVAFKYLLKLPRIPRTTHGANYVSVDFLNGIVPEMLLCGDF